MADEERAAFGKVFHAMRPHTINALCHKQNGQAQKTFRQQPHDINRNCQTPAGLAPETVEKPSIRNVWASTYWMPTVSKPPTLISTFIAAIVCPRRESLARSCKKAFSGTVNSPPKTPRATSPAQDIHDCGGKGQMGSNASDKPSLRWAPNPSSRRCRKSSGKKGCPSPRRRREA